MEDETPSSNKSNATLKQTDIREFMPKKVKSIEASSSTPIVNETPCVSESSSLQSAASPKIQKDDTESENSSDFSEPSQVEELLNVVQYFSHDSRNQRNVVGKIQSEYDTLLKGSVLCLGYLLCQGISCCGHEESGEGNFLELLKLAAEYNEHVKKILFENATIYNEVASLKYQMDLINCCAKETTKRIIQEIGDDYFGILVDVSSDVSKEELLALYLRYIDGKTGMAVERFLGVVHIGYVTALSMKSAIATLLMEHELCPSKIRAQGYDGSSYWKDETSVLKTLITKDTPCAYSVHCFAHELLLTLVAVAKCNTDCYWFFGELAYLLNVVEVSCKRTNMIKVGQAQKVAQALKFGERDSGSSFDQDFYLRRIDDSLFHVINIFPTIVELLVMIGKDESVCEVRVKAQIVLDSLESFDFVFMAHLMRTVFGYTRDLCLSLAKREINIGNITSLIYSTKLLLKKLRDFGWKTLLNEVISFCTKHDIDVPDMNASYTPYRRPRLFVQQGTLSQHCRVQIFEGVIDLLLNELNVRFDDVNMELLTCMACFSPRDKFSSFDKGKILKLVSFYPSDFSGIDLMAFEYQLDAYIQDMRRDDRFGDLNDLGALSMKLVETNKHITYWAIYLLIKLVLILPVVPAGVGRVFSRNSCLNNWLQDNTGDQLLNDRLVTFIEQDVFGQVPDDDIMNLFKKMKSR